MEVIRSLIVFMFRWSTEVIRSLVVPRFRLI